MRPKHEHHRRTSPGELIGAAGRRSIVNLGPGVHVNVLGLQVSLRVAGFSQEPCAGRLVAVGVMIDIT